MPQGACVIRQSARTSFSAHSGQSFYCKNGTASARCAALALSPPTQAFLFFAHSGISFLRPLRHLLFAHSGISFLRPLRHLLFAHSGIFSSPTQASFLRPLRHLFSGNPAPSSEHSRPLEAQFSSVSFDFRFFFPLFFLFKKVTLRFPSTFLSSFLQEKERLYLSIPIGASQHTYGIELSVTLARSKFSHIVLAHLVSE